MAFAGAGRTEKECIFSASDERGRRQIEDQAPVHLLVEVEIEIVECLLRIAKLRLFPAPRSEEHTSELQSLAYLVCRLLLEKKISFILLLPVWRKYHLVLW